MNFDNYLKRDGVGVHVRDDWGARLLNLVRRLPDGADVQAPRTEPCKL
jgi:hypothetical protein